MKWSGWKLFAVSAAAVLVISGCGAANDQTEDPANDQNQGAPAENGENGNGAANGNGDAAAGDFDQAAAEQVYQASCLACHGANLEGSVGPQLTDVGARLSADEIANIIKNGRGTMPAQAQLSDEEVQNLSAWLAAKK